MLPSLLGLPLSRWTKSVVVARFNISMGKSFKTLNHIAQSLTTFSGIDGMGMAGWDGVEDRGLLVIASHVSFIGKVIHFSPCSRLLTYFKATGTTSITSISKHEGGFQYLRPMRF